MKRILLAIALLVVASAKASATEYIMFDGGGYNIAILVGMADKASVATVRFTAPEAKEWVTLPHDSIRVEKFDIHKEVLVMHFSRPKNEPAEPGLPESFSLSVKKETAVLDIGGKQIKGELDWGM
jgi:hypothetical protein